MWYTTTSFNTCTCFHFVALSLCQRCTTQLGFLLLRHISLIFEECVRNNEEVLGRKSEIIPSKNGREKIEKKNRHVWVCLHDFQTHCGSAFFYVLLCSDNVDGTGVKWLISKGFVCSVSVPVPENIAPWCRNRSSWWSYMYLSSDSLRTRTSLICSIRHSSPSMSWTVMVESAIEMTSSAAIRHRNNAQQIRQQNQVNDEPGENYNSTLF